MTQVCQDYSFTSELASIFIGGEKILFYCDFHSKIIIHGAVNRSHSTLAKDFHNPVTIDEQRTAFYCHHKINGIILDTDQPSDLPARL
jgi:hypothetical protein